MSNDNNNNEKALHFLQKQHVLHLSTLNENNQPEVASVFYYCDDKFNLFFSTRSLSRKTTNLSQHQEVGFVVTNESEQITIQGQGVATPTNNPVVIAKMIAHLTHICAETHCPHWPPPVFKIKDQSYQVYKITPNWLRLGDFRDVYSSEEQYYTQII